MAFATVLGAFSLIVTQFDTLSTFAAVTDRLNTIAGAIEQSRAIAAPALELVEDDQRLAFEKLTLWTPKERHVLLRDLSLALSERPEPAHHRARTPAPRTRSSRRRPESGRMEKAGSSGPIGIRSSSSRTGRWRSAARSASGC